MLDTGLESVDEVEKDSEKKKQVKNDKPLVEE